MNPLWLLVRDEKGAEAIINFTNVNWVESCGPGKVMVHFNGSFAFLDEDLYDVRVMLASNLEAVGLREPEPVAKPEPVICEDCHEEIEPGTEHNWYIDFMGGCGNPDCCTSQIACNVVPLGA